MGELWDILEKAKEREKENVAVVEERGLDGKELYMERADSFSIQNGKEMMSLNNKEEAINIVKDGSVSRVTRLNKVLADLNSMSADISASAVASEDGLVMASNLPKGMEESNVAAMCAVMLSMGERTSAELGRGNAEQLFIKGNSGYVVAMRAGDHAVLLIMTRKEAKLGLVFLDVERAAEKIEQILL